MQIQTAANQGREGMQKQRRSSQEKIVQPWGRVLVPPQGIYTKYLWVLLQILKSLPRRRMVTSGWAQGPWSTTLLPCQQPIRRKSHPAALKFSPENYPIREFRFFEYEPLVLFAWPLQQIVLCSKLRRFGLFGLTVCSAHELAIDSSSRIALRLGD